MYLRLSRGVLGLVALVAIVLLAVAAFSQALDRAGAVTLAVTPRSPDTTWSVTIAGQQAIIDLFSSKGIGSAGVEVTSSAMPASIIIRFHLRGLENLRFTYASTTIEGSLSSLSGRAVYETVRTGSADAPPQAIGPGSPYWMPMTVVTSQTPAPEQVASIEVQAPADFIEGRHTSFAIDWVDFYR